MPDLKVTGRILQVSESTRRRNPALYGPSGPSQGPVIASGCPTAGDSELGHGSSAGKAKKRLRQDSRPLLNKLETEALAWLQATHPPPVFFRSQAKRYRLGNGIWFKVDFTATIRGVEHGFEIKGPHSFRGGFENLKVAASLWPEIVWVLAWKENGIWTTQTILP